MKKIQAIRGMNDLLPEDSAVWQYLEAAIADTFSRYGYREIRFPVLEKTELFKRSIGEVTDIVEKEMYTFSDRNNESLTLRPEGTACCVRACEEHGLLYNQIQRLWYAGPMFRYEKPQLGRQRQFHQFGAEAYGIATADVDAELLVMTARLWQELGIQEAVTLQVNTLGTPEDRASYRAALVEFLTSVQDQLDEDSQRRLATNPLRVLDSKNAQTQKLLEQAPSIFDFLDEESQQHFDTLTGLLDAAGVEYEVNPKLVRGLDYYTKTVFEWVTDRLGAQGTVCAGGRYDGLVEQLGGKPTPAVGFAMGVERLVLLLQELQAVPEAIHQQTDVYLVVAGDYQVPAMAAAEQIRAALPHIRLVVNCGGGSIKNQMKKADRSGAVIALIVGESEAANEQVSIKFLRQETEQVTVSTSECCELIKENL